MKQEQIIKALEAHANGCKCSQCPMPKRTKEGHSCWTELSNATLSLIRELTEDKKRLKAEVSVKKKLLDKCVSIEDKVRADTVRKMQERLKAAIDQIPPMGKFAIETPYVQCIKVVDQIAKEMLGVKSNEK